MMRVKKVEYIKNYELKLLFSDKTIKIVDLEDIIKKSNGIFSPLKDLDFFKQVELDDCQLSVCWPNGADFCPDVLYAMGRVIKDKKSLNTTDKKGPSTHRAKTNSKLRK